MNSRVKEKTWLHYYLRSTSGVIGAILVFIMVLLSLVAVFKLYPHDPVIQDIENTLKGPSGKYWFGTDQFGRDIFSRCLDGMRRSMIVDRKSVV